MRENSKNKFCKCCFLLTFRCRAFYLHSKHRRVSFCYAFMHSIDVFTPLLAPLCLTQVIYCVCAFFKFEKHLSAQKSVILGTEREREKVEHEKISHLADPCCIVNIWKCHTLFFLLPHLSLVACFVYKSLLYTLTTMCVYMLLLRMNNNIGEFGVWKFCLYISWGEERSGEGGKYKVGKQE